MKDGSVCAVGSALWFAGCQSNVKVIRQRVRTIYRQQVFRLTGHIEGASSGSHGLFLCMLKLNYAFVREVKALYQLGPKHPPRFSSGLSL